MTRAALTKAEKRAERARDDILDAKAAIDERVAESTALLSRLQVEQQRQLAEELARQQEEQLKRADDAVDSVAQLPDSATKPVVKFAIKRAGKAFEAGATGPDAYDASGLVKAAWAGPVSTSHTSVSGSSTRPSVWTSRSWRPVTSCSCTARASMPGSNTGTGTSCVKSPRGCGVKLFTNEFMSEFAGAGRPEL